MPLTNDAVTELTVQSAVYKLWLEWLGNYFDGGTHVVGNNAGVIFPAVALAAGQGATEQPLQLRQAQSKAEAEIRVVMMPLTGRDTEGRGGGGEVVDEMDSVLGAGRFITAHVLFHFLVAAKKTGKGQGQYLAGQTGDLLKALLTNPDTRYALAEKGIRRLHPQEPTWLPSKDYAERLLLCAGTVEYPVLFGDLIVGGGPGGSGSQLTAILNEGLVTFQREDPLLVNDYVGGLAVWDRVVTLRSAWVVGWAPQGLPVTLALEVNGVLTGEVLTLAAGSANTEVNDQITLSRQVPATQRVRWQVTSAPSVENSAWHVSVGLRVGP